MNQTIVMRHAVMAAALLFQSTSGQWSHPGRTIIRRLADRGTRYLDRRRDRLNAKWNPPPNAFTIGLK